ncbi:hypothetical protein [Methylobacterium oxalidis]|uniref:ASCH domain-containing protein n=1 Tax=Methylobacterium oxalidis TaxID=944322 RepID=A0A512JA86_9HYPH|nr:hypothetical protein [Methylobacterium oxalidis]GEP06862.1 hypothetical protein MOX02_49000 [Methylobacterium oxalidis]GJE35001.1 hypothetical protein LDDCCGHA_5218 [Methylobacterium oxalidis]GLS67580.1 hypothetical protein GCM10007888_59640 [Methylobacterium oxalidis]
MVAYSFKKRFAAPILAGTKAQTIRADRKRHARLGELVQLFTGMRTKHCRRLGEARCTEVYSIALDLELGIVFANDGWIRTQEDLDAFARQDGFPYWSELVAFWAAEHPGVSYFSGILIRWTPLAPTDALDIGAAA